MHSSPSLPLCRCVPLSLFLSFTYVPVLLVLFYKPYTLSPVPSYILLHPPVPSCTLLYPPVPSCTPQAAPVPSPARAGRCSSSEERWTRSAPPSACPTRTHSWTTTPHPAPPLALPLALLPTRPTRPTGPPGSRRRTSYGRRAPHGLASRFLPSSPSSQWRQAHRLLSTTLAQTRAQGQAQGQTQA